MKQINKYESPEIVVIKLEESDVIATSAGDLPVTGEDW